jgi:hypothetical protein
MAAKTSSLSSPAGCVTNIYSHIIVAPLRIKLEQMGGTSWTLEIYSAMGATTILPGLSDESERLNGNTKVPSNALFN